VELDKFLTVSPVRGKLVVASFVPGEWQDHAEPERAKLRKHLSTLDEYADEFHSSCSHVGIAPPFGKAVYGNVGLADRLFDLSQQLINTAIRLDAQEETNMRAFGRAIRCTPPSRKGGEVKDCTITEGCLEVCRQLKATGFGQKLVFCTSNISDYCEGRNLHPTLATDFVAVGLTFATNLPWAVHELFK